ncbi:MAG: SHOCT domain-containing protein [Actinobacteria bacterium]|nr:SHOCT domain-containing protein [Actinomycetota bacterium]MCB8997218.1 SHOCT domain-containing protein [Actinomycetota bacterium]MCB9414642.1 SHOCT domain-containing protein [Actinomycetota bacterium]MCB9423530.1 SHOCT domain-containing protein [Actinomycetota bacterium]HRY10907.1 SHOCT domain-containing protein [Candidatus Nanopelagicales bacterium]
MITTGTPGEPGSGTQQQAIINAVARRQYGRWAAQYRAANLWAAVQRDTTQPPVATTQVATTSQRLAALRDLWAAGVITDEELARFKAAVLNG